MKPEERYIDDVLRHVLATPDDRERLAADLRAHFADGQAQGRSTREIIDDLGTPAEVATAFNAERAVPYAGFWRRLMAFAGDFGLLLAVTAPVIGLALFLGFGDDQPGELTAISLIVCVLIGVALLGLYLFYFPLLEAHFGKTLGKHLMRIRVVRESGAPIGLGQAFVRRLSLYFEMLWIDALFIPFTERKQRALDIIAKTIVVCEPGEEAPWWGYILCLVLPAIALCTFCLMAFFFGDF